MPLRGAKFHASQPIEMITGRRVTSIESPVKTATLSTGEMPAFDKALVATGGGPKWPNIPGSWGLLAAAQ